jgi:hypothetical protein
MAYNHPDWIAAARQRALRPDWQRFVRPDAERWIRPDAYRFMPPDAPRYFGKDVVRYFWPHHPLEAPTARGEPSVRFDAAIQQQDQEIERELAEIRRTHARLKAEVAALKSELKFRQLLRALKYSPDQPRVPAGNPDGGQWTSIAGNESAVQIAGRVIRICVAGSRSLVTDQWGNKSYSVEYQCAGGRSFMRQGTGHSFPGLVIDPFQ